MSQRDTVAQLLRTHGGLTEDGARRNGIGQVRTRVLELRRQGWRIDTCVNPDCRNGHYVLVQAPGEQPRQVGWLEGTVVEAAP